MYKTWHPCDLQLANYKWQLLKVLLKHEPSHRFPSQASSQDDYNYSILENTRLVYIWDSDIMNDTNQKYALLKYYIIYKLYVNSVNDYTAVMIT